MKFTLTIILTLLTLLTYGQANNDTIQVIAKLISPGQGSKIYIAEYKVIKIVKGTLTNDTIKVGYYFYNEYQNAPDTALLNLTTYTGDTKTTDYYIFPDYDAKKGIERVKISYVDFDYWEGCETGKGECKPLTFIRSLKDNNWFLFMPCGGTATTVNLTVSGQKNPIQTTSIGHSQCPPIFDLTDLADGKYYAYMLACGLGGQIEINLRTENEKKAKYNYIDSTCVPKPDTLDGQPVYKVTEKKAEFPNGQDSLMMYLVKSIKYPQEEEYQGSIYITFIVDSTGKIRNTCIYKRFRNDYLTKIERECLRVIEEMPNWKPAEMNGQKVYSREILPIKLGLQ